MRGSCKSAAHNGRAASSSSLPLRASVWCDRRAEQRPGQGRQEDRVERAALPLARSSPAPRALSTLLVCCRVCMFWRLCCWPNTASTLGYYCRATSSSSSAGQHTGCNNNLSAVSATSAPPTTRRPSCPGRPSCRAGTCHRTGAREGEEEKEDAGGGSRGGHKCREETTGEAWAEVGGGRGWRVRRAQYVAGPDA